MGLCTGLIIVDLFITPVQLTCGHVFCRKCVSKWIYDHGNCPHCRGKAGMNNIVGINGLAQICTRVTRPPPPSLSSISVVVCREFRSNMCSLQNCFSRLRKLQNICKGNKITEPNLQNQKTENKTTENKATGNK